MPKDIVHGNHVPPEHLKMGNPVSGPAKSTSKVITVKGNKAASSGNQVKASQKTKCTIL